MTDFLIWWFIVTFKYTQCFPWDIVEANGKSLCKSRREEACRKKSEKTIKNSPGTSNLIRVWELIRRRKTADSALWHFFQGQEYQRCQLQNGQLSFISEPVCQGVNKGWHFYLFPCSSLISFLFHLYTLTTVFFIGGLRLEKHWHVPTHPPCLITAKTCHIVCDRAQPYGNKWAGTNPKSMSASWEAKLILLPRKIEKKIYPASYICNLLRRDFH